MAAYWTTARTVYILAADGAQRRARTAARQPRS